MKNSVAILLGTYFSAALAALDGDAITKKYYGNDSLWYRDRIPLFESSSQVINDVYYYRWNIFRAHQRDLGEKGFISTEFLNDVSWQTNPWASLNDATPFHLREGRWLRDRRYKRDYANFILSPSSNRHQFSEAMADAVWQAYLVDGVAGDATPLLAEMQDVYVKWNNSISYGGLDTSKGLYWIQPLSDATEYTISSIDASGGYDGFFGGQAFRPSINSYQYGNALAIANLAKITGDTSIATTYNAQAATLKANLQNSLWNSTFEHFIDRYFVNNANVTYWNWIRGRELVGYVPWAYNLHDDNAKYANAWKHLLDTSKLQGKNGLRTNEPSYQYYMRQYRYDGPDPECQWNGPAWPFQTTQVLTGLANLLDHYPKSNTAVTTADYIRILTQYAKLHYNPERGGILDLEEDYYPDTGYPIVGLTRSPHYFHSAFVDNILSGLVGIRPRDDDVLEVNPLIDSTITYFRADRILYHGHDIAVQWDATGSHYGTTGLIVEVDGKTAASSTTLKRLTVSVARKDPAALDTSIAVSIQLQTSTTYPIGSVSEPNADVNLVHGAIDGRVFFFPQTDVRNGWDSPIGNGTEVWYQITFAAATKTSRAEIAFLQDSTQGYDAPAKYRVQVGSGSTWTDVAGAQYDSPLANGITNAKWTTASTSLIRLVFTPKQGLKTRLVEFKVFS